MPRNITLSLAGNLVYKPTSLAGNSSSNSNMCSGDYIPIEITLLKISIMNTIIIPFNSKNWKVLEENLVFIDIIKEKLMNFSTRYPNIDLQLYTDLVNACESTIYLHMEVINLEESLYGLNCNSANILFKTAMLRLKPELELYNLIIGRPDPKLGQKYDTTILNNIITLLNVENITFEQIKNRIKP